MNPSEKKLLRKTFRIAALILASFVVVLLAGKLVLSKEYKAKLFGWDFEQEYNAYEPDQLSVKMDPEGVASLESLTKEDGVLYLTLAPVKPGKVICEITNAKTGEVVSLTMFTVSFDGTITNASTGDFTHCRFAHFAMIGLFLALTLLLWNTFRQAQKKLRYSYQAIFFSGLAIWMSLITLCLIYTFIKDIQMITTYQVIQGAANRFIMFSCLPMFAFSVALSASNISLIRHEGFRTRNALGIGLSFVIVVGLILSFFINGLFTSGSEFQFRLSNALCSIYDTIYVFMECFLIGAILCGTLAAKHEPEYDMDYLIILGCKIKPDGTLYPLLKGRVDRAIKFYHAQLEATGKKAVFVPSGGQGSDECISEADAMARYLLEQGIEESQILIENQSKNTLQNMRFSKKLIEEQNPNAKSAFSTTNFHVFRSGIIARQNEFEPDGMGSPTKWYFWPNAYMREVIGMMAFKWKSIVIVLIPIMIFLFAVQFMF